MKTCFQNLLLLPVLTAGFGLIMAGPLAAQTFTNLYAFTPLSTNAFFGGTNSDGANPLGVLVLSGNTLFGTTANGGSSGYGTVFAVNTDGTGFTNLHAFTGGSDGSYPEAGLVLSGTNLYGTAYGGGSSGNGTVFAVNTNGTVFAVLHSFSALNGSGFNNDGANPQGGLVLSGTNLYGTAYGGGSSGNGTVFRVSTNAAANGTGFAILHNFTALDLATATTNSDGANPESGLILSGTNLYGTAYGGGSSGNGTVFRVDTNGVVFAVLHSFTALDPTYYTNSDGANPQGGLVISGNTLYGTTDSGGNSNNGTVFAVSTSGPGFSFTNLHSFAGTSDGANPQGGLVLSGNTLYGTAESGGSSGNGTVFTVSTNGPGFGFTNLHSFAGISDGANPRAGLISSSNCLYGTAFQGGSSDNGTVFMVQITPPSTILSAQLSGGDFLLSFQAVAGVSYTLQQTTNLAGTNWITFGNIIGSGTVTQFTLPTTDANQLFFRVQQP